MDCLLYVLLQDKPSEYIRENKTEIFNIIPEFSMTYKFNQNNVWHIYDVFEHILHVVDGVPNNIVLRMAALFHDIGKPFVYSEDENGIGHFYGHWDKSNEIFIKFAEKYNINENLKEKISYLILYHDKDLSLLNDYQFNKLINDLGEDGLIMLFQLKRSDLFAQNGKFHYLLDDYNHQAHKLLKKYWSSDL